MKRPFLTGVRGCLRPLNRVDLGVYADHAAGVRCIGSVGFRVECRLRGDLFQGGQDRHRLGMGLLQSEYKPGVPETEG
jgi:hypothetical protein